MKCPSASCRSENIKVKDTIHGSDGRIYRRRRCIDCGTSFRTVEMDMSEINDPKLYLELDEAFREAELKRHLVWHQNKRGDDPKCQA